VVHRYCRMKLNILHSIHVLLCNRCPLTAVNQNIQIRIYYGAHTGQEIPHHQFPVNKNLQCKKKINKYYEKRNFLVSLHHNSTGSRVREPRWSILWFTCVTFKCNGYIYLKSSTHHFLHWTITSSTQKPFFVR
jgi:hypothetical protein